jgi:hypothetical protein
MELPRPDGSAAEPYVVDVWLCTALPSHRHFPTSSSPSIGNGNRRFCFSYAYIRALFRQRKWELSLRLGDYPRVFFWDIRERLEVMILRCSSRTQRHKMI